MKTIFRRGLAAFVAAAALLLVITSTHWAGGGKGKTPSKSDQALADGLRNAINEGARLFNDNGDQYGCYRVYQGALLSVRPLLDDHPDLQKDIDAGLAQANAAPSITERAFALRKVLGDVRDTLVPPAKKPDDKKPDDKKPDDKKPMPKAKTLWDRLGGEAKVARVVDDFLARASKDPKVNFDRDGKYKLDMKDLKKKSIEMFSEASNGPYKYTGGDMKTVHKGMGITNAEFDAAAGHLKKALESNGVAAKDVAEVLKVVESTRKDIVQAKKPDDKKPDDKKPDDKRPDTKKPDEKKPDTKSLDPKKGNNGEPKNVEPPKGNGKPEPKGAAAQVAGKVTLGGLPLANGVVTLHDGKGNKLSAPVSLKGDYSMEKGLTAGTYRVTIEMKKGSAIAVPAAYEDAKTTPLTVQVKEGANIQDLNLKSQ
jgi:hemoglobin